MLSDFALFDAEAEAVMREAADQERRKVSREDIELMLQIARKRQAVILAMKDSLLAGDDAAALRYARQVCGLPEAEVEG